MMKLSDIDRLCCMAGRITAEVPKGSSQNSISIGNGHTPRKRGIQYAAASRLKHKCLWNTGSPAGACHRAAQCADPVADDDARCKNPGKPHSRRDRCAVGADRLRAAVVVDRDVGEVAVRDEYG